MAASYNGHTEVVRLLLQAKAKTKPKDRRVIQLPNPLIPSTLSQSLDLKTLQSKPLDPKTLQSLRTSPCRLKPYNLNPPALQTQSPLPASGPKTKDTDPQPPHFRAKPHLIHNL